MNTTGSDSRRARQRATGWTGTIASLPSGVIVAKIRFPTRKDARSKCGLSCAPGIERASFLKAAGVTGRVLPHGDAPAQDHDWETDEERGAAGAHAPTGCWEPRLQKRPRTPLSGH